MVSARPCGVDARHGAVEAARDVQPALRIEGHRRGVGEAGDEHVADAVGADAIDRHARLLAARAAAGRVDGAGGVDHRAVDLVDAGGDRRADLEEHRSGRGPRPGAAARGRRRSRAGRRRRRWSATRTPRGPCPRRCGSAAGRRPRRPGRSASGAPVPPPRRGGATGRSAQDEPRWAPLRRTRRDDLSRLRRARRSSRDNRASSRACRAGRW